MNLGELVQDKESNLKTRKSSLFTQTETIDLDVRSADKEKDVSEAPHFLFQDNTNVTPFFKLRPVMSN